MLIKIIKPLPIIPSTPIGPRTLITYRVIYRIGRIYREASTSIIVNKVLRAAREIIILTIY